MRYGVDLRGLSDGLIVLVSAFRVEQVRCEYGVDEGRLAETALTDDHEVELESTLE